MAGNGRKGGTELTRRDALAMNWIGEQYAVRADLAAVVLGRLSPVESHSGGPLSRRSLRVQFGRWDRAGLARVRSILGAPWIVPTEQGLAYGGLPYAPWPAKGWGLEHVHSAAMVRAWAESQGYGWVGERALRRERNGERQRSPKSGTWHAPDGIIEDPAAGRLLVEVELSEKSDSKVAYNLSRPALRTTGVVYFTRPEMVERIRAQLARVWPELVFPVPRSYRVLALPELPGATYEGSW